MKNLFFKQIEAFVDEAYGTLEIIRKSTIEKFFHTTLLMTNVIYRPFNAVEAFISTASAKAFAWLTLGAANTMAMKGAPLISPWRNSVLRRLKGAVTISVSMGILVATGFLDPAFFWMGWPIFFMSFGLGWILDYFAFNFGTSADSMWHDTEKARDDLMERRRRALLNYGGPESLTSEDVILDLSDEQLSQLSQDQLSRRKSQVFNSMSVADKRLLWEDIYLVDDLKQLLKGTTQDIATVALNGAETEKIWGNAALARPKMRLYLEHLTRISLDGPEHAALRQAIDMHIQAWRPDNAREEQAYDMWNLDRTPWLWEWEQLSDQKKALILERLWNDPNKSRANLLKEAIGEDQYAYIQAVQDITDLMGPKQWTFWGKGAKKTVWNLFGLLKFRPWTEGYWLNLSVDDRQQKIYNVLRKRGLADGTVIDWSNIYFRQIAKILDMKTRKDSIDQTATVSDLSDPRRIALSESLRQLELSAKEIEGLSNTLKPLGLTWETAPEEYKAVQILVKRAGLLLQTIPDLEGADKELLKQLNIAFNDDITKQLQNLLKATVEVREGYLTLTDIKGNFEGILAWASDKTLTQNQKDVIAGMLKKKARNVLKQVRKVRKKGIRGNLAYLLGFRNNFKLTTPWQNELFDLITLIDVPELPQEVATISAPDVQPGTDTELDDVLSQIEEPVFEETLGQTLSFYKGFSKGNKQENLTFLNTFFKLAISAEENNQSEVIGNILNSFKDDDQKLEEVLLYFLTTDKWKKKLSPLVAGKVEDRVKALLFSDRFLTVEQLIELVEKNRVIRNWKNAYRFVEKKLAKQGQPEGLSEHPNPDIRQRAAAARSELRASLEGLKEGWDERMARGNVFVGPMDQLQTRSEGKYIVLHNPTRVAREVKLGRASVDNNKVVTSFKDPNFKGTDLDFNKILSDKPEQRVKIIEVNGELVDLNINYAPVLNHHFLVIPYRVENQPQVMTHRAIRTALSMFDARGSENMLLGFNSMGARASINHLHFQGAFYENGKMPIEKASKTPGVVLSGGVTMHTLTNYPVSTFVFESEDNREELVRNVGDFVNLLKKNNIPHAIIFRNGKVFVVPSNRPAGNETFGAGGVLEMAGFVYTTQENYEAVKASDIENFLSTFSLSESNQRAIGDLFKMSRSELRSIDGSDLIVNPDSAVLVKKISERSELRKATTIDLDALLAAANAVQTIRLNMTLDELTSDQAKAVEKVLLHFTDEMIDELLAAGLSASQGENGLYVIEHQSSYDVDFYQNVLSRLSDVVKPVLFVREDEVLSVEIENLFKADEIKRGNNFDQWILSYVEQGAKEDLGLRQEDSITDVTQVITDDATVRAQPSMLKASLLGATALTTGRIVIAGGDNELTIPGVIVFAQSLGELMTLALKASERIRASA